MPTKTKHTDIYKKLQQQGFRLTKARRCLITVLMDHRRPLSVAELQTLMKKRHIVMNITTVYRELEFLRQQGLLTEVQLGDNGTKRFEFSLGRHHHHIRCIKCNRIADVDIPHTFTRALDTIRQQTDFQVIDHSLEFAGMCGRCQE